MKLLKFFVILLFLLSIATLSTSIYLYYQTNQELISERDRRIQLENDNSLLEKEKARLTNELSQVREAREQLARQLEEEVRLARELNQRYENEKNKRVELEQRIDTVDQLQAEYDTYRQDMERKIQNLMQEISRLRRLTGDRGGTFIGIGAPTAEIEDESVESVTEQTVWPSEDTTTVAMVGTGVAQENVSEVDTGISEAQTATVELPEIEVTPKQESRVLLINSKFNFIVTNLGEPAGLRLGDVLFVKRNGTTIARVKVSKFFDTLSACDIEWLKNGVQINQGDIVSQTE